MHRGWNLPEIIQLICAAADSSSLVALAQTCRALHPPAVSVLWRDQTSLVPLLKCLPSDIWKPPVDDLEQTLDTPKTRVQFRWVPQPADWTRLFFYATHVKTFIEDGKLPAHLTAVVYAYLSFALADSGPLFPNVRSITWRTDDGTFAYLRILVGDKMQSIVLGMHGSQHLRSSIMPFLTTRHAGLVRVEFEPPASGIAFGPTFSEAGNAAICRWGKLEVLRWSSLDEASLEHLARLPCLRVLRLQTLPTRALSKELEPGGTRPCFAALRELHARAEELEDVVPFFDAIKPEALRELRLSIEGPIGTEEWEALTMSLPTTLTHLSLIEEFTLEDSAPGEIDTMVKADHLRPLLSFSALEELTLISGAGVDLDNAFIADMATAWPLLRKLDISPVCQPPGHGTRVTLAGLQPLAQRCLSLASLCLMIDISADILEFEASGNKPGDGIVSRSLTHLHVADSLFPVGFNPAVVASYLSAVFPNLQSISRRDGEVEGILDPWDDSFLDWRAVERLYPVFAAARAQER